MHKVTANGFGVMGLGAGLLLAVSAAHAGVIVSCTGIPSFGNSPNCVSGQTGAPNDDNSNIGYPPTNFGATADKFFTTTGAVDMVFRVNDSQGVTEYYVNEYVFNNTVPTQTFSNYTLVLGFGTGSAFTVSLGTDGLDFDTPNRDPTPASTAFSNLIHDDDVIHWSNGSIPAGASGFFELYIDVPDFNNLMTPFAQTADGYEFTLRQIPNAVPSPSVVSLFGLGLALLGWTRRVGRSAG